MTIKKIIVLAITATAVGGLLVYGPKRLSLSPSLLPEQSSNQSASPSPLSTTPLPATPLPTIVIQQTITFSPTSQSTDSINITVNETVLDVLLRTKKVEVKEYSFGKLVESIDGVKNGTNNKYWLYYVNGAESKIGAGEYKLQASDAVEWKFKAYEE